MNQGNSYEGISVLGLFRLGPAGVHVINYTQGRVDPAGNLDCICFTCSTFLI